MPAGMYYKDPLSVRLLLLFFGDMEDGLSRRRFNETMNPIALRLLRNDEYLTTRMRCNYRLWFMLDRNGRFPQESLKAILCYRTVLSP